LETSKFIEHLVEQLRSLVARRSQGANLKRPNG
jgi:hypothetical protein